MNATADIIKKYFPEVTPKQHDQFAQLEELYKFWNAKINVISRNDIAHLYERHVLFSLSIAKIISFRPGTRVLDIGTGGGFPGIPLAIYFPGTNFHLVDSIGKKIKVVNEIVNALRLENVTTENVRAENVKERFDFVVSRAVTSLDELYKWAKSKIATSNKNTLANGIIYLKGGEINDELLNSNKNIKVFDISSFFDEEFFDTKKIVFIPV